MFIPLHDQNKLENIKLQFVTLGLIAINILVWMFTAGLGSLESAEANAIFYSYGYIPAVVGDVTELPPEYVRIPENASYFTYAFFHGGFMLSLIHI